MLKYDERHTITEAGLVRDFNRLDLKEKRAYDPQYLIDLLFRLQYLYKRGIGEEQDVPVLIAHVMYAQGKTLGFSTGICGSETRGYGVLDHNGYWEFPLV